MTYLHTRGALGIARYPFYSLHTACHHTVEGDCYILGLRFGKLGHKWHCKMNPVSKATTFHQLRIEMTFFLKKLKIDLIYFFESMGMIIYCCPLLLETWTTECFKNHKCWSNLYLIRDKLGVLGLIFVTSLQRIYDYVQKIDILNNIDNNKF